MISINRNANPNMRLCELGGGSRPTVVPTCLGGKDIHIDARMCNNHEGKPCVDLVHDLSVFPWPPPDNEFDGVIAVFVLEHIPYFKTVQFLKETLRITKPGARSVFIIPNTEAQCKWILDQNNKNGWDGKDYFTSASEKLFGSQDDSVKEQEVHKGSYHCAFFNPEVANDLFQKAGFEGVTIQSFGERKTDLIVYATKPVNAAVPQNPQEGSSDKREVGGGVSTEVQANVPTGNTQLLQTVVYTGPNKADLKSEQRAKLFDRNYFDRYPGSRLGFYWDFPQHQITFNKVMERKPVSVLELGCGRGYILKRLEDAGVKCYGLDISKHAYLTRVSEGVGTWDVTNTPWVLIEHPFYDDENSKLDLCFSNSFLEYIPEEMLENVVNQMVRTCKRGLHGITFLGQEMYPDGMRCTLRTKEWWQKLLPKNHEVVSSQELETGEIPGDFISGDGRTKLNIGCAWTMFHQGWQNIDIIDGNANQFASQYRYNFRQADIKNGLPFFGTGVVDLIFSSHMLEHLSYSEGSAFLKECRRVIRPTGGLRLIVPDAGFLMETYSNGEDLSDFGEVNLNCANAPTSVGKIWALLHEGHKASYDGDTLCKMLEEADWTSKVSRLRKTEFKPVEQILKETVEMSYGFSLFVDAVPKVG